MDLMGVDEDAELERRIERAQMRLCFAQGKRMRREAWDELSRLIKQRSPEQIAKMEEDLGLR